MLRSWPKWRRSSHFSPRKFPVGVLRCAQRSKGPGIRLPGLFLFGTIATAQSASAQLRVKLDERRKARRAFARCRHADRPEAAAGHGCDGREAAVQVREARAINQGPHALHTMQN